MARKKTETVETAAIKPRVTRAKKPMFKGWTEVRRGEETKFVCPNCGAEFKEHQIRMNYMRCPVCGESAE